MDLRKTLLAEGIKDADYIGDGVYIANDGFHVWIYCQDGPYGWKRIALDPGVMTKIIHYNKLFMEACAKGEEIYPHLNKL